MRKRILALALSFCMALSLMPQAALAADHVHDDTCGYAAPVACGHTHNDDCGYAEAVGGQPCAHESGTHNDACGGLAEVGTCSHTTHDGDCGYAEAVAGAACTHTCTEGGDCGYSAGSVCTYAAEPTQDSGPDPATTYYTITYTDGVDGEEIFADQSYEIAAGGSIVYFNTEIASLTREGYVFNGWTPQLETTVTKDATYTAVWNVFVETGYTITYTDGVDGEVIFEDQVNTDVESGTSTPAFEGTPTRAGFTFAGWTPEVANTVTGNATYTAQWTENAPATHTHSYTQTHDKTNHWDVCSCGDKQNEEKHKFTYTFYNNYNHTIGCTDCDLRIIDPHYQDHTGSDDKSHWVACKYCDVQLHIGSHTFDDEYDRYCNEIIEYDNDGNVMDTSECGYDRHTGCAADGDPFGQYSITDTAHERTCEDCGLTVRENHTANTYSGIDAAAHTGICVCGKPLGESAHTWMPASTHSSICFDCGYYLDNHTYTAFKPSEANPETYHVLHCSVCGEMSDPVQVAGHNYEVKYDKDGHWNQCTDCGYTTAKTAHRMTVSRYDGTSLVHINSCSGCEHDEYENCDFKQGTYAGNEDGHWAVCFACGRTHSGIPLQAHVDENADGTCDVCGEPYSPPAPPSGGSDDADDDHDHDYEDIFISTERDEFSISTQITAEDGSVFEVGFIPGDGVTLPDDAELVVEEHYPSLAPIASTIVPTTETEYVDIPENNISRLEDIVDGYKLGEIVVIDGEKYMVCGGLYDYVKLIRLSDEAIFEYDTQQSDLYTTNSITYDVEIQTNRTIVINGTKYDVPATMDYLGIERYVLYVDGVQAGLYFPSGNEADFVEGYDPETLKAQQDDNDLGSVTIPADYNNAAIADLAPGKTYNVSVIGANDISVEGYDDALLNSITEDTPEIAAAKAEVERLKADRAAKVGALAQLDANHPDHPEASFALYEAEKAYKEALAALADLTNLQGATVSQTYKIPDALVGAKNVKYVGVHDTNPYAAQLAEAEQALKSHMLGSTDDPDAEDAYNSIKELYDKWEEEHGSGAEFGTVTVSDDGKIVTVTYAAVDSFSPFIVYAFVEADEPEYKVITTNTEPAGGEDDVPASPATGDDTPAAPAYTTYTVQSGDTLWAIARKYGCTVSEIVAANSGLIKDPNLIYAGWQLNIPQAGATGNTPDAILPDDKKTTVYIVKQGDTLWAISQKYGCIVAEIVALNGELITDPDLILVGWELLIPQD